MKQINEASASFWQSSVSISGSKSVNSEASIKEQLLAGSCNGECGCISECKCDSINTTSAC